MAIRNAKLGGSDFTNGEVLYDYDLDDTFNAMYDTSIKLMGVDTTGGTQEGDGFVKLSEVSVPAEKVSSFVVIKVLYTAFGVQNDALQIDFRVDETSLSDSPLTALSLGDLSQTIRTSSTIEYYYEPTQSEKDNGFNVQIYGDSNSSSTSAAIEVFQTVITGV